MTRNQQYWWRVCTTVGVEGDYTSRAIAQGVIRAIREAGPAGAPDHSPWIERRRAAEPIPSKSTADTLISEGQYRQT